MPTRNTPKLIYPIENFRDDIEDQFRDHGFFQGKDWGIHLGVDFHLPADTKIFSIGRGTVVYSKLHGAEISEDGKILKQNWGGIVIIAHKNPKTKKLFYSLYGHLGKRYVKKGDMVEMGELLGTIGKSESEMNGGWPEEHLHFAIYHGPYHGKVLPGYWNEEQNITKVEYWSEPINFIKHYNLNSTKNNGAE
ncbi:MAG: M23 family metallopeptidase [Patescibacteria group bacterium]